jgi:hypothetical protein
LFIVTHDSDFYQLISDKTTILNLDGVAEPERHYSTGQENLWFNIIGGKMSNKVPGLKFKKDLLKDFLGSYYDYEQNPDVDNEYYRRVSRQEQHYLVCNLDRSIKWITETPDLIENDQHIINQKILDFKEIPIKYTNIISQSFWKKYSNLDDQQPIPNPKVAKFEKKEKKTYNNPFAILTVE